ncbi:MAG: hypothetical protein JXB62_20145 [Pirellulales bacterium]|nr:hypothetical protein [Pirellulales bacterium]
MRSPPVAIAWQLWARGRWWLIGVAVWLATVVGLCEILPQGAILKSLCILPVIAAPLGLSVVFLFGADTDLASNDTSFPRWMFTLPVSTPTMVGWPMLYGTVVMTATCLAVGQWVLRAVWPQMPLWWPALLAAGCLAWLQALAWSPSGLPWLRLVTAPAVVGGLMALPSAARSVHLPEPVLVVVLAVQIPVAYAVAVLGVTRARRGDLPDWRWLTGWVRSFGRRRSGRGRVFRSPARAQLWFEWRIHGIGLPLLVGLCLPLFAGLIILRSSAARAGEPPILLQPAALLLLPLYAVGCTALSAGTLRSGRGPTQASPFLATRPMDCAGFVVAKFQMALFSVLCAYALAAPAALALTVYLRSYRTWHELLTACVGRLPPAAMFAIGLVAFGLLVAFCWRLAIASMFSGLAGRTWVAVAVSVGWLLMLHGLAVLGWWLYVYPQYRDAVVAAVPYVLAFLVVLKLLLAVWAWRAVYRRRMLEGKAIVRLVGLWLATVAALLALAAWLVAHSDLPGAVVAFCVILSVPLLRIGLCPLALEWNRHR